MDQTVSRWFVVLPAVLAKPDACAGSRLQAPPFIRSEMCSMQKRIFSSLCPIIETWFQIPGKEIFIFL